MNRRTSKQLVVSLGLLFFVCCVFVFVRNGNVVSQSFLSVGPVKRSIENITQPAPVTPRHDPDYTIPSDDELNQMDEKEHMRVYWRYINSIQALCNHITRVGSMSDGGKEICVDSAYIPKAPCTIYSFGINNQFDFDKDISSRFGCDVYCFDPSMKTGSHRVNKKILFSNYGIGDRNYVNDQGWNIKTFASIRRELGHTNTTIDILKIDVEGDEWISIPEMISSGALDDVRQIAIETHVGLLRPNSKHIWGGMKAIDTLKVLRLLYDSGYRIIMRERNLGTDFQWPIGRMTNVNEITLIKI